MDYQDIDRLSSFLRRQNAKLTVVRVVPGNKGKITNTLKKKIQDLVKMEVIKEEEEEEQQKDIAQKKLSKNKKLGLKFVRVKSDSDILGAKTIFKSEPTLYVDMETPRIEQLFITIPNKGSELHPIIEQPQLLTEVENEGVKDICKSQPTLDVNVDLPRIEHLYITLPDLGSELLPTLEQPQPQTKDEIEKKEDIEPEVSQLEKEVQKWLQKKLEEMVVIKVKLDNGIQEHIEMHVKLQAKLEELRDLEREEISMMEDIKRLKQLELKMDELMKKNLTNVQKTDHEDQIKEELAIEPETQFAQLPKEKPERKPKENVEKQLH